MLPLDCSDGDVRLVGGEYNNEGTVEVCFNNLWGLVSDVGWNNTDALVVCNQLGYTGGCELKINSYLAISAKQSESCIFYNFHM